METNSFVMQKFMDGQNEFNKEDELAACQKSPCSPTSVDGSSSSRDYENDYRNFLPIKRRIALRASRSPSMCISDSDSCNFSIVGSPHSPDSHISEDSGIETSDHDAEQLRTDECSMTHLPTEEQLKESTPLENSNQEPAQTSFPCRWLQCTMTFNLLDDLVAHVNDAHVRADRDASDFRCFWEGCQRKGKGFNARYKMLIHIRTHTNEKPYTCELCHKSFSRLENLKIHNRSHTGERPYICPFEGCNKAYSNSSDRFKHVRTHQEQKPYVCRKPGCCKRYTDPSSLRKHIKTHGHFFPKDSEEPAVKRSSLAAQAGPVGMATQKVCDIMTPSKVSKNQPLSLKAAEGKLESSAMKNPSLPMGHRNNAEIWNSSWSTNKFSQMLEEYCREKYLNQKLQPWPLPSHPLLLGGPSPHPLPAFFPSFFPMFSSKTSLAAPPSLPPSLIPPTSPLPQFRIH